MSRAILRWGEFVVHGDKQEGSFSTVSGSRWGTGYNNQKSALMHLSFSTFAAASLTLKTSSAIAVLVSLYEETERPKNAIE